MFCTHCGNQIPDSSKFCPKCGADVSNHQMRDAANQMFNKAEAEVESAVRDVGQSFSGGPGYQGRPSERLKDDRSLVAYILLSIITCNIYGYWFLYNMAHDVNIACEGDGESTAGLVAFCLLSFVTCGIYAWIWYYKLGNRLAANAPRYQLSFPENGTTILMWQIFGLLLCYVGSFMAIHILIKNSNQICNAYNRQHGYY